MPSMIVVQRVRVRWDTEGRSAPDAGRRRGLDSAVLLPALPDAALVVHDVLIDTRLNPRRAQSLITAEPERAGETEPLGASGPAERLTAAAAFGPDGQFPKVGEFGLVLWFDSTDLVVKRALHRAVVAEEGLPWATYPRGRAGLFTLPPGRTGRWRINYRLAGGRRAIYETWNVGVSNGAAGAERFLHGNPYRDVDQREHLYGGRARSRFERADPHSEATRGIVYSPRPR